VRVQAVLEMAELLVEEEQWGELLVHLPSAQSLGEEGHWGKEDRVLQSVVCWDLLQPEERASLKEGHRGLRRQDPLPQVLHFRRHLRFHQHRLHQDLSVQPRVVRQVQMVAWQPQVQPTQAVQQVVQQVA
jgi:hypothetical protein